MTLKEKDIIRKAIIAVTGVQRVDYHEETGVWRLIDERDPYRAEDLAHLEVAKTADGRWQARASTVCDLGRVRGESRPHYGLEAAVFGAIYDAEENAFTLSHHASKAARRLHELRPSLREMRHG